MAVSLSPAQSMFTSIAHHLGGREGMLMSISVLENANVVVVHDGARDECPGFLDAFASSPMTWYKAAGPDDLAVVTSELDVEAIVLSDGAVPAENRAELVKLLSPRIPVVLAAGDYESGEHLLEELCTAIASARDTPAGDGTSVEVKTFPRALRSKPKQSQRRMLENAYLEWVELGDDDSWQNVEDLALRFGSRSGEVWPFDLGLIPGVTTAATLRYLPAVRGDLTLHEALALACILNARMEDCLRPVRNANGTYRLDFA
jgi:hypothetical protein